MPGPSVFPSREPAVSGNFWGSQEGCHAVVNGWWEGRDNERHTLVLTGVIRDLSIGYQLGGWLIPAARLFLLEYKASLAPTEIGARDADAVMLTAMVPFSAEVEG